MDCHLRSIGAFPLHLKLLVYCTSVNGSCPNKTVNPVELMRTLSNDKEKEIMEMTPTGYVNEVIPLVSTIIA